MADKEKDKDMPFLGHLEELRWRLVKCSIAIIVVALVVFFYIEWITDNIFLSLAEPDFPFYRFCCWAFDQCAGKIKVDYQSTEVTGQFMTSLVVSILGGVIVAFPFIFYQLWSFVKPGLKQNELKQVKGIIGFVSLMFFIGISFGYFVIAPLTVQFFGTWTMSEKVDNNFRIANYISVVSSTVFFTGLLFLLPVVILIFSKLGILSSAWLKRYRRHAFVAILILAAIITPPDLLSQIVVSVPIILLYEFGILLAKHQEKKKLKLASNS